MKLTGRYELPTTPEAAWSALLDTDTLKQCLPGCERLEKLDDTTYRAALKLAFGPVKARFEGTLTLHDVEPPRSTRMRFEGQGGIAGFGKGEAQVTLTPAASGDAGCVLEYVAEAMVGGKLAQIGSRLIDAAAGKLSKEFFQCFSDHLAARPAVVPPGDADRSAAP